MFVNDLRQTNFVLFAGGRRCWRGAQRRLAREVTRLDENSKTWLFDPSMVTGNVGSLAMTFSEFASQYPRGHGLWVWKPWAILNVLNQAMDGDAVIYLDAGCTVQRTPTSHQRYHDYLAHIRSHGSLFFQMAVPEYRFTKQSVLDHFQLDSSSRTSGQIAATVVGFLASDASRQFVTSWLDACSIENGRLLWDVERDLESKDFIAHRHDQSVLSCLVKSRNYRTLPDETYFHPNWRSSGSSFPFWGTRKCSELPLSISPVSPKQILVSVRDRLRGGLIHG